MTDISANNKRLAKNTLLLYFRMVLIMGVTLFTSRVILQTLGVEDYGIYNVVGGIVAMFSFISSSLTTASQRYITFELGKGKDGNVSNVFSTCVTLHLILAIIVAVIIEPIGIWFINNKLMIPLERIGAAMWVFQFTILSMMVMFVSVPYNALIVAHEKMNAFALVSIIDAGLRLGIAYFLLFITSFDKLIVYGFLMLFTQMIIRVCYTIYCKRAFTEVSYSRHLDKSLMIEMGKFATWSIFGNVAFITYTQGLNVLLGTFFSPVVNAARGIAVQIQGAVNTFVGSFQTAINPQITKNYAANNLSEMINLVFRSSRFSFYLLMIVSLPVLLRTSDILKLWLQVVPEHTITFVRIILLTTWINSIANPLIVAVKATGKIKRYESTVGGLMIAILPISYLFLRLGFPAETVFLVHLVIECIAMTFRIWNAKSLIHFSFKMYVRKVLMRIFIIAIVSFIPSYWVSISMADGFFSTVIVCLSSFIISAIAIVTMGLNKGERSFIFKKNRR